MSDATERAPSLVADRYRLDERIGSGPMGEVWRGYDTRADWVVAVKVLGAKAVGSATREVLKQHAQAAARVIHPNVAMVLDVGDEDGAPFLVMEFLTGLSLGEELAARGPLPIVEVCDLIGQAAAGLDAAHRAGVVHGQVDPDSFRRAGSGVLKAVGFGMHDKEPPVRDQRYVAPERVAGQAAQAPGDLYALGAVCYELLCGHPPAASGSSGSAVPGPSASAASGSVASAATGPSVSAATGSFSSAEAHSSGSAGASDGDGGPASGDPAATGTPGGVGASGGAGARGGGLVPPSAHRPEVPAELDRLVLAMLAEDPAKRPAGGESIRRALAAIARPRANPAAPPRTGAAGGAPGGGATEVYQFATPRAGDTAIYQAGDLGPEPGAANRRLFIQLGAAVAIIAVVTVVMVVWAVSGERQAAVSTPSPSPSTSIETPFDTPSSNPTPGIVTTLDTGPTTLLGTVPPKATLGEAIPPGGWGRWLQAFDEALNAQQAMGGIDPAVAAKAREKIRKAGRKFDEGHMGPALNHVGGVYRDLVRAQEKGDMVPGGPLAEFMGEWRLPGR
ncbi:serine/threonine-protein kinase [Nonomuraea sp. B5E05]|uniref:serine/threonine-protein kinase n=1 Tax=Nonomuraea sp. B5E05 TaxID=3153569 RepID=UPI0032605AB4